MATEHRVSKNELPFNVRANAHISQIVTVPANSSVSITYKGLGQSCIIQNVTTDDPNVYVEVNGTVMT